MATSLLSVLKGVTVFPYDTETMESLSNACQNYSSDISLDDFEACMLYLCQGISHDDFVSFIEDEIGMSLPDRIYRGLAGYVVALTMDDEDLAKQKKVLFSLVVKNVMVFSFSSIEEIVKNCISPQFYIPYDEFWVEQSAIGGLPNSKLFSIIFSSESFDHLGCTAYDVFPAIQILPSLILNWEKFLRYVQMEAGFRL